MTNLTKVEKKLKNMAFPKKKGGYYYCKNCSNITFHDNKGHCENTQKFGK